MDSSILLLEATFTRLCNHVGVGDMAFRRGYIFTMWPMFNIKGVSCAIMLLLQALLFRLRGDVMNRENPILSLLSINPLIFIYRLGSVVDKIAVLSGLEITLGMFDRRSVDAISSSIGDLENNDPR